MPDNTNNGGLSLEALLAAARGTQEEAVEAQPVAAEPAPIPAAQPAAPAAQSASASAPTAARASASSAAAGAAAAGTSAARAQAVPAQSTEAAEPVAEPSAAVQEEALEKAEEAAPAFDLAAALGYGRRDNEPAPAAVEPEEKFDLAAALGYKSQEVREREAAEAAAAEAAAQAQAVQDQAYREAERQAHRESDVRSEREPQPMRSERVERAEQPERMEKAERPLEQPERPVEQPARAEVVERPKQPEPEQPKQPEPERAERIERSERIESVERTEGIESAKQTKQAVSREEQPSRGERTIASVRESERPQVRSRSFEATKTASVSPEERYAAKNAAAQSATGSDGTTIESYQPTKRDRSAQARAARPLKKAEVSEVAQAIAAQTAATEFVEEVVEEKVEKAVPEAKVEAKGEVKEAKPAAEEKPAAKEPAPEKATEKPAGEKLVAEARFTEKSDKQAAPLSTAAPTAKEPAPPATEPVIVAEIPPAAQPKPAEPAPAPVGQPVPVIPPATPAKPVTMPHKVPVRTTEEVIRPTQPPVKLGVISPEAARHEAATKKKVQSTERKIVKKVRRFRTLGMFLIVLALAALAGAIFLFVAGNAQANESIEAEATKICEQAGRTITYRYKAADANGTLCPTTEVATFSAGDVLEQSVITMNTPDFETAGHTLANFKKQFEKSSYVDGRVDGSTVIFTLHMSNERIMKVTYTALLMKNTTGCEVII